MTAELQHNSLFVTDDDVTITVTNPSPPPPTSPPPTPSNRRPTFDQGANATRRVPENTGVGENIGNAVSATDPDGDTLTYSLAGTDRNSFVIVASSGQLQTSGALDHEVKSSYTVTVRVNDGKNDSGGSSNANDDSITVTITVTDVNEAPVVDMNIGNKTLAVGGGTRDIDLSDKFSDPDGDMLYYSVDLSNTKVTASLSGSTLTIAPVAAGPARVGVTASDRTTGGLSVVQGFDVTVLPPPSIPTGLRANGDLDSGNITLRWNEEPGATGYDVRYTEETCDSDGDCSVVPANWREKLDIQTSGSGVIEADLGGLTEKTLYRVEVRSVKWGALSGWSSGVVSVFPTDSALGRDTPVATAPFHGFQAKNSQGSHEFRYILCESTIPAGLDMNAKNMKNAVDKWKDTVIWDRVGANIITTSSYPLSTGDSCASGKTTILAEGRFEVRFTTNDSIRKACAPLKFWGDGPPACWRSESWINDGIDLIESGSMLLNAGKGKDYWNSSRDGCKKLQNMLVHEVGHAFGIGNAPNRHPVNTKRSIMTYDLDPYVRYCEPQAYDIVAVTALYQSR